MKEGFVLKKGKVYPLSREEREEVHKFIKEQLRKGYIRPSKSPQTAPVFFVGKKIGRREWYRIINISISGQSRTTTHYHSFRT